MELQEEYDEVWRTVLSIAYSLVYVVFDIIPVILSLNGSLAMCFIKTMEEEDEEVESFLENEHHIEEAKVSHLVRLENESNRSGSVESDRKSSVDSADFPIGSGNRKYSAGSIG